MPEPLTHARAEKLAEVLPDLIAAAHTAYAAARAWLDLNPNWSPEYFEMDRATIAAEHERGTADLERALDRTANALAPDPECRAPERCPTVDMCRDDGCCWPR